MIFCFVIIYSHQLFYRDIVFYFLLYLLILFLIILLRLGFIYTKHNFFKSLTDYDKYFIFIKIILFTNLFFFVKNIIYKKNVNRLNFTSYLYIYLFICILVSILNNIYVTHYTYFIVFILLFSSFYNLSNFNYKNLLVHIMFIIFSLIYLNYNIQYYTYYYHTIFQNNLNYIKFKKHLFDFFLFNKNKNTLLLMIGEKNNHKISNTVKFQSFKQNSLIQNIINYF